MSEKRVVLIKPGDVLLIGGVRFVDPDHGAETMRRFRELTGISPAGFFADDIQIDALTAEQVAELAGREEPA